MFGLSWMETLVILVVGLVVIGPEDLPIMIKKSKAFFAKMRALYKQALKQSGLEELHEFERDVDEINNEVRQIIGDDGKLYDSYDLPEDIKRDEEK